MNQSEAQGLTTKELILQHVYERILAGDLASCSVDEIAASIVISKKTFYKHFKNKEDMLHQVIDRLLSEARRGVERITNGEGDFITKLNDLMSMIALQVTKIGKLFTPEFRRYDPKLWQKVQEFRRERIMVNFARLLHQGVAEGHVRKEINPQVFLMAYVSAIEAVMQPAALIEASFSPQEAMRSLLGLFFKGLLTDESIRRLNDIQQSQYPHS